MGEFPTITLFSGMGSGEYPDYGMIGNRHTMDLPIPLNVTAYLHHAAYSST